MTFVIMQAPNNGYYWLVKATSKKHFELVDSNFREVSSGEYEEMREMINALEYDPELIHLWCEDTNSLVQVSEDCLHKILAMSPDYLNNKKFV